MPSLNTGWFRGKTLSVTLTLCKDELCNCYINKFVGETLNHAVLDSGCTKTVCELSLLGNYLET